MHHNYKKYQKFSPELDKDFSGEISLNAFMTVTENNRFASESDIIF